MTDIKGIKNSFLNFLNEVDNSKLNKPLQNNNKVVSSLFPANGEWLESINGKIVNQVNLQQDKPTEESFWVRLPIAEISDSKVGKDTKPDDKLAGKLRDSLLREEFGFSNEDIEKLTK